MMPTLPALAEMLSGVRDAAMLVDPLDVRAMTKAIQTIDADTDLRADLARRGARRAKVFSPAAYIALAAGRPARNPKD